MPKFTCHACHDSTLNMETTKVFEHKSLLVTLCEKCKCNHYTKNQWHTAEEWTDVDERGKCIYCEICGEGGTLMCCDKQECKHSYCLSCLEMWLTKSVLDHYLADDTLIFDCFVCLMKKGDAELKGKFPVAYKYKQESEKFLEQYKQVKEKAKQKSKEAKKVAATNNKKSPKAKQVVKEFRCYSCFKKHDFTVKKMPKLHKLLNVAIFGGCFYVLSKEKVKKKDR